MPTTLPLTSLTTFESWRLLASLFLIVLGILLNVLWAHVLKRSNETNSPEVNRARMVWSKNFVWTLVSLGIIAVWGSKIAGFALSVAAFAGAILIVGKELLLSVLGYLVIVASQPYRIGQYIEVGGFSGRVLDIDVFATTIYETGTSRQLTGKTVAFPNSFVISMGVRNLSATGEYLVNLYKLILPYDCDMVEVERMALSVAEAATASWRDDADAHFRALESLHYLDLPSSRPKVLWEPLDNRGHTLTLRFACPVSERVATEQEIFRKFWSAYRLAFPVKNTSE